MTTRSATHAGSWYPASKTRLEADLTGWLSDAHANEQPVDHAQAWKSVCMPVPIKDCRAIIAPHAGYSYSGRAAAWAYKLIDTDQMGTRFSYTYYQDPHSTEPAKRLSPGSPPPEYPIHQSIESLDKEAIEAISLQDPSQAHETFKGYLKRTKNTICGRHPIGVLLGSMIKLQQTRSTPPLPQQQLQLVRYEQSSQCFTLSDSSVSYVSAFLRLPA
ncbi:hypothetical protein PGT21_035441 [Puccinia graminis f. sp. tritici]|uniref:AmmeMemoRadiSam system protein B n=1 Tax=Puccinia graminis f. sp. tritici TaxID=56615 RepID=A0A5B0NRI8_PUCGR|nr:hypothetical protein PGT21_035441 [Puccinia graminis f. sp. tritici]